MAQYYKNPGFFGEISREKAQSYLSSQSIGTYLVRLRDPTTSQHPGNPFTISFVCSKNGERIIQHKLVHHEPLKGIATYECNKKTFPSLLVRVFVILCFKREKELIKHDSDLKEPFEQSTTDESYAVDND
jgi:hypothetical protein